MIISNRDATLNVRQIQRMDENPEVSYSSNVILGSW